MMMMYRTRILRRLETILLWLDIRLQLKTTHHLWKMESLKFTRSKQGLGMEHMAATVPHAFFRIPRTPMRTTVSIWSY